MIIGHRLYKVEKLSTIDQLNHFFKISNVNIFNLLLTNSGNLKKRKSTKRASLKKQPINQ